jgi:hypothetical protein
MNLGTDGAPSSTCGIALNMASLRHAADIRMLLDPRASRVRMACEMYCQGELTNL